MNGIIIEAHSSSDVAGMLKVSVAAQMSEWHENLLSMEVPEKEEFESEEEYREFMKMFMTDLVDAITSIKGDMFKDILNSYNDFLSEKIAVETQFKEEDERAKMVIRETRIHIKRIGIASLVITLILPSMLPIVLVINLPRIGLNLMAKKVMERNIEKNRLVLETMEQIQLPFYDFVCTLRDDYHKSNQELKELREKASQGENVIEPLLQMVNPERLALKTYDLKALGYTEEEEKIITKKKDN